MIAVINVGVYLLFLHQGRDRYETDSDGLQHRHRVVASHSGQSPASQCCWCAEAEEKSEEQEATGKQRLQHLTSHDDAPGWAITKLSVQGRDARSFWWAEKKFTEALFCDLTGHREALTGHRNEVLEG